MTLTPFLSDVVISVKALARELIHLAVNDFVSYGGSFYTKIIYPDQRYWDVSEISIISL
jgi:hypothetical protein